MRSDGFGADLWLRLQEGLAECIANEDGERQIACAVSFFGEELVSANLAERYEMAKENTYRSTSGIKRATNWLKTRKTPS